MALQAAFDESGKLKTPGDIVFGGCIFEIEDSKYFGRAWLRCLDDEVHAYSLHMKDAMRCEGDFKCYENNEAGRDEALLKLASLAHANHPLLVVYCSFEACVAFWIVSQIRESIRFNLLAI